MSAEEGPREAGIEARLLRGWRLLEDKGHDNGSEPAA